MKFLLHFYIFIQVIGSLVKNSGFEDIVYQSGLCTSGSLLGVLAGSHYNRAWVVHLNVSEALERLMLTRFLVEVKPKLPNWLEDYVVAPSRTLDSKLLDQMDIFYSQYQQFREKVRLGGIGKTAQFWMIYMDMMKDQILIHNAVQSNNFDALLYGWKAFLPLYFIMNKVNYAR